MLNMEEFGHFSMFCVTFIMQFKEEWRKKCENWNSNVTTSTALPMVTETTTITLPHPSTTMSTSAVDYLALLGVGGNIRFMIWQQVLKNCVPLIPCICQYFRCT